MDGREDCSLFSLAKDTLINVSKVWHDARQTLARDMALDNFCNSLLSIANIVAIVFMVFPAGL